MYVKKAVNGKFYLYLILLHACFPEDLAIVQCLIQTKYETWTGAEVESEVMPVHTSVVDLGDTSLTIRRFDDYCNKVFFEGAPPVNG